MKHIYTYQGEEYSSRELAEIAGISPALFTQRVHQNGWSVEEAIAGIKSTITVKQAKRDAKGIKLTAFATCERRCNAK
jgi:hypothetical protein